MFQTKPLTFFHRKSLLSVSEGPEYTSGNDFLQNIRINYLKSWALPNVTSVLLAVKLNSFTETLARYTQQFER